MGVSPVIIITRASNYIRKRLGINSAMRMHLAFAIVFIITEGGKEGRGTKVHPIDTNCEASPVPRCVN